MNSPKIISKIEDLPETLWYPQKGSKNITDLYRGQPVAESIAPKDIRPEKLVCMLEDLNKEETPLYERLPGVTGALLDHWQQILIRFQQTETEQEEDFTGQAHAARKQYFLKLAKSPASPDFHYINEARIRENAAKDAKNQLAQQIAIIEKNSESLEEKVFEALGGEFGRQDIKRVLNALIGQSLTIGQVYKALLPQLVTGRAVIGCELIEPEEITAPTKQGIEKETQGEQQDTAAPHTKTAEERRQEKMASIHKKLRAIQKKDSHKRKGREEEQPQAKITSAQAVIQRLSDMNFQQAEVLMHGDFLIQQDESGAFVLSYTHPLSEHIDQPIRIVTMGIKDLSPAHAREYEKNIGKSRSLNIYGQIIQRLHLDKEVHDIVINPYAIY
jgi:hypothetical protein